MIGNMLALLLSVSVQSLQVEAQAGFVAPATPETDTPAVAWDFRLSAGINEDWGVFVSAPFWRLSNFHPTSNTPDYLTGNTAWPFDLHGDYSEKHSGLLLGVGRRTGPVSIEAAAGRYSRELMLYLSGIGKSGRPGEIYFAEDGLMASLAVRVPFGDYAILSVGTRTEGFDHWYFNVASGLAFTLFSGGGGGQ